jgi:tetratricopeptide (TPR) repeat protein
MRLVVVIIALWCSRAAAAPVDDPDTEIARRHFQRGLESYEALDYERALAEFRRAQRARPLPELDFNIARCLDRLERWEDAIAAYKRYVLRAPNRADAAEAFERVRTLRARLSERAPDAGRAPDVRARRDPPPAAVDADESAANANASTSTNASTNASANATSPGRAPAPALAPAPAPALVAPAPRDTQAPGLAAPIAVGVAAFAVAAAGAGLLGSVAADYPSLETGCSARPCTSSDWSSAEARAYAGYAALGLAGAAAIVDVILWVRYARGRRAPRSFASAGVSF